MGYHFLSLFHYFLNFLFDHSLSQLLTFQTSISTFLVCLYVKVQSQFLFLFPLPQDFYCRFFFPLCIMTVNIYFPCLPKKKKKTDLTTYGTIAPIVRGYL